MKVVVPIRTAPHHIDADPEAEGVATYRWLASKDDLVALEAARTAVGDAGTGTETGTNTVAAVGIGGDRAEPALRAALRAGADEAVHVTYDPVDEPLGEKYARVLARVVERVGGDVLFVGEDAPTMGTEVVSVAGERLGWRSANGVTDIGPDVVTVDVEDTGDDAERECLFVERRLAPGRREVLRVDTPAVLGVDSGFANPQRGSLEDVLAAQRRSVGTEELTAVAPDESRFSMSVGSVTVRSVIANERLGRGAPPRDDSVEARVLRTMGRHDRGKQTSSEVVDVPPTEAAERVVAFLREHELL